MKMTKEALRTFVAEIFESLAVEREAALRKMVDELGKKTVENKILGGRTLRTVNPEDEVKERMGRFFQAVLRQAKTPDDLAVLKDLSEGTDSTGGYLVPTEFLAELVKRLPELSELYPHVRKFSVARDSGTMPSLATDVTATWTTTENTDQGETNPAFGEVTWAIKKLTMYTDVSNDLLDDAAIDVAQEVTELFVEKAAAERDRTIAIGDGSTEPSGLFSATLTQSVSIGTLSYAKLVDIEMTLPKKYRMAARWVMNNTNVKRCMKITDTNNNPIFNRDPAGKHPPTLLGYPIAQQDDGPDTNILFGDLGRYAWFGRKGMDVATDGGGAAFKADQTTIRFKERADGKLLLTSAFAQGKSIDG